MKQKKNIYQKLIGFILKRKIKSRKRDKGYFNLKTAKTISILFDASDDESLKKSKKYFQELTAQGKKVFALGIVEKDENKTANLFSQQVDYFVANEINSFGKIKNSVITDFINNNTDMLINLCLSDITQMEYVFAMSNAKFKVSGIPQNPHADFILDVSKNKKIDFYISQINHYLNIIEKA